MKLISRRQLNKQQSLRIEAKQSAYQHSNQPIAKKGLVLTRFRKHAIIEDEDHSQIHCSVRPNLELIVAGDNVIWQPEGSKQGVIVSLCPRHTILGRFNRKNEIKPIAANITQIIIVIAIKPDICWDLLDSYLVAAEVLNIPAHIILNKVDLDYCQPIKERLLQEYQPLGYNVIFTHANIHTTDKLLLEQIKDQISVFVGQSGVGKSTIISKLLPEGYQIVTNELSSHSDLGQHTTSNSHYYHLTLGGALIDSPGVREFSLWNMSLTKIAHAYREFRPYLSHCKFRDCKHLHTPGCAIYEAVQAKKIHLHRYENFVAISRQFAHK